MPAAGSTADDKLANILKTSAGIFAEKGYHQASIRDISRATGISLSGLYYYVDSKEEILFLIQDHCFGTILAELDELLEGSQQSPSRKLRMLVGNHLRFFVNNMQEMKVLSHEADSLTGEFRNRVNARKKRYTTIAMGIIEELPHDTAVDLRVATFGLFGMMNWIYNWYRPQRDVPVEVLADHMTRLFLRGYLAADGEVAPDTDERVPGSSRPSIWRQQ